MTARAEWPDVEKELSTTVFQRSDFQETVFNARDDEVPETTNMVEISFIQKMIRKGLSASSNETIEIRRQDPASPLHSCKKFEELNLKEELARALYAMGYNVPSKIQEAALPALLADPPQNVIAQSQSGTGKTAAFVLAMLSRVDTTMKHPQAICLSPTYELAIQTGKVAAQMSQYCPDISIKYVVRGEFRRGQKLTNHILIGTPGKLLDWALKFDMFDMNMIKVFVLDEADVMISTQGHHDQCIRLHAKLSPNCQMLLFSATYDQAVMEFAEMIIPNPLVIRLLREEESLENIKQYYVKCVDENQKYNAITNIYGVISIGQAIIFCRTRRTASWLAKKMREDGHSVSVLSGELPVEQRILILQRFRAGVEKVLVTTNVLSRGIDVQQVSIVVNFDMPVDICKGADYQTYLHRIGRTGRFGKPGIAINLIDSSQAMDVCLDIQNHYGKIIICLDAEDPDEIKKLEN
ncbi:DEAD-box helicase Dbp80-like [Ctenocephalides felis]|uniref:DEAD-box helicase Dbp80-like n=1 Tax=Ctenocephalides felis TaxID=7515 RepID=UPI000E6E123E|nr:DEAD-box helicase Dbp80-like [Ctenocephalides felis]